MDMHHVGEFAERGAFAHQDADLLNNVGRMGAIGMATEDKTSLRSDKKLQHAFGLAHCKGFAIGPPEGFLTLISYALFLELVFRRTDTGGLGTGEDSSRHDVEADVVFLP